MAYFIQGNRVSESWYYVLKEVERRLSAKGQTFQLNDGQRTFQEQARLRALFEAGIGNLAAVPSHTAPHIKTGREDHALDIDQFVGVGTKGVVRILESMGIDMAWTVASEGWHVEAVSEAKLKAVAAKLKKPRTIIERLRERPLRRGAKTPDVKSVQTWLKRGGFYKGAIAKRTGTFGPELVKAVKAFQKSVRLRQDGVVGPKTAAAMRRRWGFKPWQRILARRRKSAKSA